MSSLGRIESFREQQQLVAVANSNSELSILQLSDLSESFRIPTSFTYGLNRVISSTDDTDVLVVSESHWESDFSSSVSFVSLDQRNEIVSCQGEHSGDISGLALLKKWSSVSSTSLVISGSIRHVNVNDGRSGKLVSILPSPPKRTCHIHCESAWGASGVFVSGWNGSILRYDVEKQCQEGKYKRKKMFDFETPWKQSGHSSSVHCLTSSMERNLLFSAGYDKVLKFWDRDMYDRCQTSCRLNRWAYSMCYEPSLHLLLIGETNGIVEIWDDRQTSGNLRIVKGIVTNKMGDENVKDMDRVDDRTWIAVIAAEKDGNVFRFDPQTGKIRAKTTIRHWCNGVCVVPSFPESNVSEMGKQMAEMNERLQFLLEQVQSPIRIILSAGIGCLKSWRSVIEFFERFQ